jgi:hypothetical protein
LAPAQVGPADGNRAVDGHAGLVEGDAFEGGAGQRGLQGEEAAEAVAEHEAGTGGRAYGFDVRALGRRTVRVPLRAAGSAPAPLDGVHREPVCQRGGESVEVRRERERAGHHDQPRAGSDTAIADRGAVGGVHRPDHHIPLFGTSSHAVPLVK